MTMVVATAAAVWFAQTSAGASEGWGPLPPDLARSAASVGVVAIASLAPAAVLMLTAYVRISIVLALLRQALGSPQIPGNQVVMMLSILLTILVMKPVADVVAERAIRPFAAGELDHAQAFAAGAEPVKQFMVKQIVACGNERYLIELHDLAEPPETRTHQPEYLDELPLRVVAAAFLISEINVALWMGFAIYLPFLVIDLVTAAVLAAMGLYLLPPAQVAIPLKLMVFVLAEGWWLVAQTLLRSFES
jgi:flagellar biosynthetic protein FliP